MLQSVTSRIMEGAKTPEGKVIAILLVVCLSLMTWNVAALGYAVSSDESGASAHKAAQESGQAAAKAEPKVEAVAAQSADDQKQAAEAKTRTAKESKAETAESQDAATASDSAASAEQQAETATSAADESNDSADAAKQTPATENAAANQKGAAAPATDQAADLAGSKEPATVDAQGEPAPATESVADDPTPASDQAAAPDEGGESAPAAGESTGDDPAAGASAAAAGKADDAGDAADAADGADTPRPAQSFAGSANGVVVNVKAPKGALPEGTELSVAPVASAQVVDSVEAAVGMSAASVKAIDIVLRDADGKKVEPKKALTVKLAAAAIAAAAGSSSQDVAVVHVTDSGAAKVMQGSVDGNAVTFKSADFSTYAVAIVEGAAPAAAKGASAAAEDGADAAGDPAYHVTYKFFLTDAAGITTEYQVGGRLATQTVGQGDELVEPQLPVLAEHQEFSGWYEKDTGKPVQFGAVGKLKRNAEIEVIGDVDTVFNVTLKNGKAEGAADWPTLTTVKAKAAKGAQVATAQIAQVEAASPNDDERFLGWASSPDATAPDFQPNQNAQLNDDITLYPVFGRAFWLYFDENDGGHGGGASYTAPQRVLADQAPARPANPERVGYTFLGWYDAPEDGAEFVFDATTRLTESTRVYARWAAAQANYTVVFWQQKATDSKDAADDAKSYDYRESSQRTSFTDALVALTQDDMRKNYPGFHFNASKSTPEATVRADGTTVLNVYYDRELVVLNFAGLGETGPTYAAATEDADGLYGYANGEFAPLTRTKTGSTYSYTYSARSSHGSSTYLYAGKRYKNVGDRFGAAYVETDDRTGELFGTDDGENFFELEVGEVDTYSYTFADGTEYTGTRFTRGAQTRHQTLTGLYGQSLEANGYFWPEGSWGYQKQGNPAQLGYLGQFALPDSDSVTVDLEPQELPDAGTVYVYLQNEDGTWPKAYTDKGAVDLVESAYTLADLYDGFSVQAYQIGNAGTMAGAWTQAQAGDAITIDEGADLGVRFARSSYQVEFRNGAAGSVGAVPKLYGEPLADADDNIAAPAYPGNRSESAQYTFLGWFADPECTTYVSFGGPVSDEKRQDLQENWGIRSFTTFEQMPPANLVVYAGWSKKWFNVTLDVQGGSLPEGSIDDFWVKYGDRVAGAALMQTERAGHTLVGWNEGTLAGDAWDFETGVSSDLHLVAQWAAEGDVRLVYDAGAGSNAPADAATYALGTETVAADAPEPPAGGMFAGWQLVRPDGSVEGTYFPGQAFKVAADCVIHGAQGDYLQLAAAYVTYDGSTEITYNANGGEGSVGAQLVPVNATVKLSLGDALHRDGYTLVGWSLSAGEGNKVNFKLGASITADKSDEENNVLYAVWAQDVQITATGATDVKVPYDGTLKVNADPAVTFAVAGQAVDELPGGIAYAVQGQASGIDAGTYEDALSIQVGSYDSNRYHVITRVVNGAIQVTKPQVTVTVKGAEGSAVYDGAAHAAQGFTATASNPAFNVSADLAFSGRARAERADAGVSPMGLKAEQFSLTNDNFELKGVEVQDGSITIEPMPVEVHVKGQQRVEAYDGKAVQAKGYQVVGASSTLFDEGSVSFVAGAATEGAADDSVAAATDAPAPEAQAERTDEGTTPMGLAAANFACDDPNFDASFVVEDGFVTIAPAGTIVVTIEGDRQRVTYDGQAHAAEGYTFTSSDPAYTQDDFEYGAEARVERTDAGVSTMGLNAAHFANKNAEAGNVVFVVARDGQVIVDRAAATVHIAGDRPDPVTYDRTEHAAQGYEVQVEGDAFDPATDLVASVSPEQARVAKVDAGTYAMGLSAADFANANPNIDVAFQVTDGQLVIDPVTEPVVVSVEGAVQQAEYDGAEHVASGFAATSSNALYQVEGAQADFAYGGDAAVKATDAGTYALALRADQFRNLNPNFADVTFQATDGQLTIGKLDVAVRVRGNSATVTYDGVEQAVSGYVMESSSSPLYDQSKFTFSGEARVAATDAGTYALGLTARKFTNLDAANFNVTFEVEDGLLTINPVADEVVVQVKGDSRTVVYDGAEHAIEGYEVVNVSNALYDRADFTFEGSASVRATDAADEPYAMGLAPEQFVNLSPNFANVRFEVTDGQLTIKQLPVTVDVAGQSIVTYYDGTEHAASGLERMQATSDLYDTSAFVEFSGEAQAARTESGLSPMGLTADQFANTNGNFDVTFQVTDGVVDVRPLPVAVTVAGAIELAQADGTEHVASGYAATATSELFDVQSDLAFKGAAQAARTDAGMSPMGLKAEQFQSADPNFDVAVTVAHDGYVALADEGTLIVSVAGAVEAAPYDGVEHVASGYTVSVSDPAYAESDVAFSGQASAARTDAGTTAMGLDASQFANANDAYENVQFIVSDGSVTVGALPVVVQVQGQVAAAPYDAREHAVEGYRIAGVSSELLPASAIVGPADATARAARTDAGTTAMGLSASQFACTDPNFQVSFDVSDGAQTIMPIDVTVQVTGARDTSPFAAVDYAVEGFQVAADVNESLAQGSPAVFDTASVVYAGQARAERGVAGKTAMGLDAGKFSVPASKNYRSVTFVVDDGYQEVLPIAATVHVSGHRSAVTYDGAQHEAAGFELSADVNEGLEEGATPVFALSNVQFAGQAHAVRTDAGTTPMGLAAEQFTSSDTDNFSSVTFVVEDGALTVNPANVTVSLNGATTTVSYDGAEHAAEGYAATASSPLYVLEGDEADFAFAGQARAVRTDAGTTPMGLAAGQFANLDPNFDVTFEVQDGAVTVEPRDAVVTIVGATAAEVYDGSTHVAEGFSASADVNASALAAGEAPLFDVNNDLAFGGVARAELTDAGTVAMGLAPEQFSCTNPNFGNVTFQVTDGGLTVEPLDVTVQVAGAVAAVAATGAEQQAAGFTATATSPLYKVAGDDPDFAFEGKAVASGTQPGTYAMGLAVSQFANVNDNFNVSFQVTDGTLLVGSAESTVVGIVGAAESAVYDGAEHEAEGFSVVASDPAYTAADVQYDGDDHAARTDAGREPMNLDAQGFQNINDAFGKVEFVLLQDGFVDVQKAQAVVQVAGAVQHSVYDGSEQSAEGYSARICDATGIYAESDFAPAEGVQAQAAGTHAGTYAMGLAEGTFAPGSAAAPFANANRNFDVTFAVTDGALVIDPVSSLVTVQVEGVQADAAYDGAEHAASGYTATASDERYVVEAGDQASFAYEGLAAVKAVDAGTYPQGLDPARFANVDTDFGNVAFSVADGQLVIAPAPVTVQVEGHARTVEYSGAEQVVQGYDLAISDAGYAKESIRFSGSAEARGTDAASAPYAMGLSAEQFRNIDPNYDVTFQVTDGGLTIEPVTDEVRVTIVGTQATRPYNGSAQFAGGYEVLDASKASYRADFVRFTGDALATGTNAAEAPYAMGLTSDQFQNANPNFENVVFQVTDGSLTIVPRSVTVVARGAASTSPYDGKAHRTSGFAELATSDGLYDVAQNVQVNATPAAVRSTVGTTSMGLSADQFVNLDPNFNVEFKVTDGYQAITALPVDVAITGARQVAAFDGQPHEARGYTVVASSELFDAANDLAFSGDDRAVRTEAGVSSMGLAADQFSCTNPNFRARISVAADGLVAVAEPDEVVVAVMGQTATNIYDGSAHAVSGYTFEASDPAYTAADFEGPSAQVATEPRIDAGTTALGLEAGQFHNVNADYQKVTFIVADGSQVVSPLPVGVTVRGNRAQAAYDAHEHAVWGWHVDAATDPRYDVRSIQGPTQDQARASRADAGTSYMGLDAEQFGNADPNFDVTFAVEDGYQVVEAIDVVVNVQGARSADPFAARDYTVLGYQATADVNAGLAEGEPQVFDTTAVDYDGSAVATRGVAGRTYMGLSADAFSTPRNPNYRSVTFVVADGYQEVVPVPVTVTIKGARTAETYDGAEHRASGYEAAADVNEGQQPGDVPVFDLANIVFDGTASAARTNVGMSWMGLSPAQFSSSDTDNFSSVTFVVEDGYQSIEPASAQVSITGASAAFVYDGQRHAARGFTATASTPLYAVDGQNASFAFAGDASAELVDAGTAGMGLSADQFSNLDPNFDEVTFTVDDGGVTVAPLPVQVQVTGNVDAAAFDGRAHRASGYQVQASSPLYNAASDLAFSGAAQAIGTQAAAEPYAMGLAADQFQNVNPNFDARIAVTDGYLKVAEPGKVVVLVKGALEQQPYTGQEVVAQGYTFTASDPAYTADNFTYEGEARAARTDAGTTAMGLAAERFANQNPDFPDVEFVVVSDGAVTIQKAPVTATLQGARATVTYDRQEQVVEGYEISIEDPTGLYAESDVRVSADLQARATGTDAGTYAMGLPAGTYGPGAQDAPLANANPNFDATFVVVDGELAIEPVQDEIVVTVQGVSQTGQYSGTVHTASGFDAQSSDERYRAEADAADFAFAGSAQVAAADAGTYAMGLTADQFANANPNFANVSFQVTDGSLTIEPLPVQANIAGHVAERTYNGAEQAVEGFDFSASSELYTRDDVRFAGNARAAATDAADEPYAMGLTPDQFANANPNFDVTFEVQDGGLSIAKRPVTVNVQGASNTVVYDGQEHELSGFVRMDATDSRYDTANVQFTGEESVKRTEVGTSALGLAPDQFQNADPNYDVTFNAVGGALEIVPLPVSITVTGQRVLASYDGVEHEAAGYAVEATSELFDAQADLEFVGEAQAARIAPGLSYMGLEARDFVCMNPNFDATVTVARDGLVGIAEQGSVLVGITGARTAAVYDGRPHAAVGFEVVSSDPAYSESDFAFTPAPDADERAGTVVASRTDAGTTELGLDAEQFQNLNDAYANVEFIVEDGGVTVDPAPVSAQIVGRHATYDYDATQHMAQGYDVVGVSSDLYDPSSIQGPGDDRARAVITHAGTQTMGLAAPLFENADPNFDVTFDVVDGVVEVEPVDVVAVVEGASATVSYDGNEHAVAGYTVRADVNEGLAEGQPAVFDTARVGFAGDAVAQRTDAGTSAMGLEPSQFSLGDAGDAADFATVTFQVEDGWIQVAPADATVVIAGNGNLATYDAQSHQVEGYRVESSTHGYTADDFVFTGTARAARIGAGTTAMGLAADQFVNVNPNFDAVTFEVRDGYQTVAADDEVVVHIAGNVGASTYDGERHEAAGYTVESSSPAYTAGDFTFTAPESMKLADGRPVAARTNAGTARMGLAAEQFQNANPEFQNVTFVVDDGYQVVQPAELTVYVSGATKTVDYSGQEHEAAGYVASTYAPALASRAASASGDAAALYDPAESVAYDGEPAVSRTAAGITPLAIDPARLSNTDPNFDVNFEVADGQLVVRPISATVAIAGQESSVLYDGQPHEVNGYDVISIQSAGGLYGADDFAFAGTASLKRTAAGYDAMGLSADQFQNLNDNFEDVEFRVYDGSLDVQKRSVVLTSGSETKVYDGEPLISYDVQVEGDGFAEGDEPDLIFMGEQTLVGTSPNAFQWLWTEQLDQNYDIDVRYGELTVTDGTDEAPLDAALVVSKTHEPGVYSMGDQVEFNIDVTNVYDNARAVALGELEGVQLDDTSFVLEPGQTRTVPATYTITAADVDAGSFVNVVEAAFGGGRTYEARDTVFTSVPESLVEVTKKIVGPKETYAIGDDINFQIVVANDSDADLEGVTVTDALSRGKGELAFAELSGGNLDGTTVTFDTLPAGEKRTLLASYRTVAADNGKRIGNSAVAWSGVEGVPQVASAVVSGPAQKTYRLTINYVYASGGKAAAPSYVADLAAGDSYDVSSPQVDGYLPSYVSMRGTMPAGNLVLTVRYSSNASAAGIATPPVAIDSGVGLVASVAEPVSQAVASAAPELPEVSAATPRVGEVSIDEGGVPLVRSVEDPSLGAAAGGWSLVDLLAAAIALVAAAFALSRRRGGSDDGGSGAPASEPRGREAVLAPGSRARTIAAAALAAIGIALLIATQNFAQPMTAIDAWTPAFVLIALAAAIVK